MDDDDISIPGCISPNHDKAILEDSCTESQKLGGTSSGKDTPTENLEINLASFSVTDNGEANSGQLFKKKKKKAKRNKINPLDMEPSAGVLAPLKPLGKLAPLNGKLSGDNPSFDLQPLPPLKPNADSEEDLVV
uniref:Uncharacterized protein n=1 Tax=Ciona savignyi TaxID=51511 RepID=H2ZKP3_CIOSA